MVLAVSATDLTKRYNTLRTHFSRLQEGWGLHKWKELLEGYIQKGSPRRGLEEHRSLLCGKDALEREESRTLCIDALRQLSQSRDFLPPWLGKELLQTIEKTEKFAVAMFALRSLGDAERLKAAVDKSLREVKTIETKLHIEEMGLQLEALHQQYIEAPGEAIHHIRTLHGQILEEVRKTMHRGSDSLRNALERAQTYCQHHEYFGALKLHCQKEVTTTWRSQFWTLVKKLWEIQDPMGRQQRCAEVVALILEQKNQDRLFGFSLANHALEGLEVMEFLLQDPPSHKGSKEELDKLRINFAQSVCVLFFDDKARVYAEEVVEKYARRAYEELDSKHRTQKTGTKPLYLGKLLSFLYRLEKERGNAVEEMEKRLEELHAKANQMLSGRSETREQPRTKAKRQSGDKRPRHGYDYGSTAGARRMHADFNRTFEELYQQCKRAEVGNDLSDLLAPAQMAPAVESPGKEEETPIASRESSPLPRNAISDQMKEEIGKRGEQIVYRKLLRSYDTKYPHCERREIPLGMEWVNRESGVVEVRVTWHNKESESKGPKDLTVEKPLKEKTRVIEVKATYLSQNQRIHLSPEEYQMMVDQGDRYTIFRVYEAMGEQPRVVKYRNPARFYDHPESLPRPLPGMGQIRFGAVIDLPDHNHLNINHLRNLTI